MVYATLVPLEDHIYTIAHSDKKPETPAKPSLGVNSYFGLMASLAAAPLYLYSTLKGKFEVWDEILDGIPDDTFRRPTLDAGAGRGMVLLKVAERKKKLAKTAGWPPSAISPAYGIDAFKRGLQRSYTPVDTYKNAAAMDVVGFAVLNTARLTEKFPFADGAFSLVTSHLVIHNANKDGRVTAVREMARVCASGGKIIIVDLYGHFKEHQIVLEALGWKGVEVSLVGFRMSYGVVPCQMLVAVKP